MEPQEQSNSTLEKGKTMQLKKKRWLGLAFAPALFALIGFASPAQAANYSGDCAGISVFNGSGNVDITNTGTCSLPNALTASGFIHVNSTGAITAQSLQGTDLDVKTTGGAITTQALTSTNGDLKVNSATDITTTGAVSSKFSIQANANSGKIAISGNLASNQSGAGGNILLVATGNVSTGSISTNSGGGTAGVEIHANTNAVGTVFTLGAASVNGVNTTINTSNATAGGQNPNFIVGGLYITNGNAGSNAGIKITNASNINVAASGSRSGIIYLDARKGTITLPTGALSSSGPAGQPAGQIVLMADTLKTVNNTVITASQTSASFATNHGVIVAASNITVAGAGGLKINGDGNGVAGASQTAYGIVLPTGGISVSSTAFDTNNVNNMLWTPSSITSTLNAPVTVSGAGAFTLTANGNNSRAAVYAYPITFSNAAVTISSKGTTNHQVELVYSGTFGNTNGLTLSGTGAVTIDASGSAGNDSGGTIYVLVDQATINASVPSLTIKADAKGTGVGGLVTFQPTKVVSLASPTVNMSANNGKTTSGAGVVNFQPNGGNGTAAITSTTFNLTANGPTAGNGDAGVVFFGTSALTQASTTKSIFSAKGAAAGIGKGGFITVFPGAITDYKLGTNPGNVQVIADGGLSGGDAGTIRINPFPGSLTIDTANAVSAKALGGNAKGGKITLVGNPNLVVNPAVAGATINADGKGTGSAGEIHILANGTLSLGTAAGSLQLSAKGDSAGTGDGGIIELGYITDLTTSDLSVAGGTGTGSNAKGGIINIHDGGSITVGSSNFDASGSGDGKGGDVTLNAALPVNLVVVNVNAKAGINGNGAGGTFTATSAKGNAGVTLRVNTIIKVDAGSNAVVATKAGTIALNGVTCGQWKTGTGTGSTSWPKTYWNCAHAIPESYETAVPNAVLGIPSSLRNTLGIHEVPIYIFGLETDFNSFFKPGVASSGALGISDFTIPYAAVWEYVTGQNVTAYLPGNVMHELGHLTDAYTVPIASTQPGFVTATNSTISAMTGTWPMIQVPTCSQVYGSSPESVALCTNNPSRNPWEIFTDYLGGQNTNTEMFANYFQACSGYPNSIIPKQAALKSTYMSSLRTYFNSTIWPGGCAP
jgi:hypothetical protein